MWLSSDSSNEDHIIDCFPSSEKSSVLCLALPNGLRGRLSVGFSVTSILALLSIYYLSGEVGSPLSLLPDSSPVRLSRYNLASCARLDLPFEFESPPDFTKLSIESWTECREVKAKEGWKVEHCTAPDSTWTFDDQLEDMENSNGEDDNRDDGIQFLFRPKPRPEGQPYLYLTPPEVHTSPRSSVSEDVPRICNPSGYFRVQRHSTPSSSYTIGSDHQTPGFRCRNNPSQPISLNETVRDYADNFAGPDTFRAVIDGPEHYVANQQINLGNCTYAVPYVLSRPGLFWLVQIERGYEDFRGLNENFNSAFIPKYSGDFILPELGLTPAPEAGFEAHLEYSESVAQVYKFTVCWNCSAGDRKYEDWPLCSTEPSKSSRAYGVLARSRPVLQIGDLSPKGLERIGARPSCRYSPRLISFESPETVQTSLIEPLTSNTSLYRANDSAAPILPTIEEFRADHSKTQDCLSRHRSIYFVGDSHVRQLLTGVTRRFEGYNGDLQDFKSWETHTVQLGGVSIRQDFDAWFQNLPNVAIYMLSSAYIPFSDSSQQLSILEKFDTVVMNFGSWPPAGFGIGEMWTSERYLAFMKGILWDMAQIRHQRQLYYNTTGYGYSDLTIILMGNIPWPDIRETPDMRTNNRLQYWDGLVNTEIEKINEHYKEQGGMIDWLDTFSMILPFRKQSPDGAHHLTKAPVDAIVQVLTHKFDLCRAPFTPKFPVPTTTTATAASSPLS